MAVVRSLPALALVAALACPAPASAMTASELFMSACLDGALDTRAVSAREVGFTALPEELREEFRRRPKDVKVWQVGSDDTWLYVFDGDNKRGHMKKTCGVASYSAVPGPLVDALDHRLAGGGLGEANATAIQWLRPQDGYTVTLTPLGSLVVTQIDWLSDKDQRDRAAAIDIVDK